MIGAMEAIETFKSVQSVSVIPYTFVSEEIDSILKYLNEIDKTQVPMFSDLSKLQEATYNFQDFAGFQPINRSHWQRQAIFHKLVALWRSPAIVCQAATFLVNHPEIPEVFAVCRPPGHHSGQNDKHLPDKGHFHPTGFCGINLGYIACRKILEMNPEKKILYLDVDAHEGDGNQRMFCDHELLKAQVRTLDLCLYSYYSTEFLQGEDGELVTHGKVAHNYEPHDHGRVPYPVSSDSGGSSSGVGEKRSRDDSEESWYQYKFYPWSMNSKTLPMISGDKNGEYEYVKHLDVDKRDVFCKTVDGNYYIVGFTAQARYETKSGFVPGDITDDRYEKSVKAALEHITQNYAWKPDILVVSAGGDLMTTDNIHQLTSVLTASGIKKSYQHLQTCNPKAQLLSFVEGGYCINSIKAIMNTRNPENADTVQPYSEDPLLTTGRQASAHPSVIKERSSTPPVIFHNQVVKMIRQPPDTDVVRAPQPVLAQQVSQLDMSRWYIFRYIRVSRGIWLTECIYILATAYETYCSLASTTVEDNLRSLGKNNEANIVHNWFITVCQDLKRIRDSSMQEAVQQAQANKKFDIFDISKPNKILANKATQLNYFWSTLLSQHAPNINFINDVMNPALDTTNKRLQSVTDAVIEGGRATVGASGSDGAGRAGGCTLQ
jgi:acetoin utilization deacetylase AcuC-like enzyme